MFYSTLAGFIELGESFEDAVKREVWEEAGIRVRNVKYHSGQSWVRSLSAYRIETLTASRIPPISWLVFMRSEIPWNLSG